MMGKVTEFIGIVYGKLKISIWVVVAVLLITGIFLILTLNVGYNKEQGCYWKPADVKIDIKKEKLNE